MFRRLRAGSLFVALLCTGLRSTMAQPLDSPQETHTYVCAANAHCNVYCAVDGEKQFQTGSPKEITVTPLARNNFLVELTEQSGATQFAYLAGTKVVCIFEGVTKKGGG
jgi:hypothetical protein